MQRLMGSGCCSGTGGVVVLMLLLHTFVPHGQSWPAPVIQTPEGKRCCRTCAPERWQSKECAADPVGWLLAGLW